MRVRLLVQNTLNMLLEKGYKYMFVSNSDNLGATMDLKLLTWFKTSGAPFAMECAARTDADKKGGHLAKKADGSLLLVRAARRDMLRTPARTASHVRWMRT
jgi:UDP-N-acetylglucosamine pyrophosphorylase